VEFRLTDEQIAFQDECHAFARDVMRPVAAYYDREQEVPYDVVKEARKRGLHGLELNQKMATDDGGQFGVI
jgi:acyl-CoA dehydrogenase